MLNYDEIQPSVPVHDKDFWARNLETVVNIKNMSLSMNMSTSISKHWLFYFKPNTRTFLYSDVNNMGNNLYFDRINLNMTENINLGNCSVLGEDGMVYYLGGVNGKINTFCEAYYKNIYQLDFTAR